jgi:hypothetical protein
VLEAAQLVDVEGRELTEARLTLGAEGEAHDSVIVRVDRTRDEPGPYSRPSCWDASTVKLGRAVARSRHSFAAANASHPQQRRLPRGTYCIAAASSR